MLFERAIEKWKAQQEGREYTAEGDLGDIVMVPRVKEARERGVLESRRPFERFTDQGIIWPDGTQETFDAVIWCTGFRPGLDHLHGLDVIEAGGRVDVEGTRSRKQPGLWLVGYGDWTGFAA